MTTAPAPTLSDDYHRAVPHVETRSPERFARGTGSRAALPPREVFGPYIVHELLGQGGMGSVHRATRHGTGQQVALKRLFKHLADDSSSLRAFAHEAQLASRLFHDNTTRAWDFGKVDGTYYIALDLVPGPTLAALMSNSRSTGCRIPIGIVVEILIQLCDALDHAHNLCDRAGRPLGLVHRDVSPSNIIVSSTGVVKLIDFGIAKAAVSDQRTEAGVIKGKLDYLAPESTYGQVDSRADLFQLGVIAHELLTGERLFRGESDFVTLLNIREKAVRRPSTRNGRVTSDLDDIVLTALHRDPTIRWQNARAMGRALRAVASSIGVVTRPMLRDWVACAMVPESSDSQDTFELDSVDLFEEPTQVALDDTEGPTSLRLPVRVAAEPTPSKPAARAPHRDTQLVRKPIRRRRPVQVPATFAFPLPMLLLLVVIAGATAWHLAG